MSLKDKGKLIYLIDLDTIDIVNASFSLPDGTVTELDVKEKPRFKEIMAEKIAAYKESLARRAPLETEMKSEIDRLKLKTQPKSKSYTDSKANNSKESESKSLFDEIDEDHSKED